MKPPKNNEFNVEAILKNIDPIMAQLMRQVHTGTKEPARQLDNTRLDTLVDVIHAEVPPTRLPYRLPGYDGPTLFEGVVR